MLDSETRLYGFGRFSLELGPVTAASLATQKARALLAYLVAHHDKDAARERLLELLWPETDPDRAREGLRSALWSIRRIIRDAGFEPDDYLTANRAVVRWTKPTWFDVEEFLSLARSDDLKQLRSALTLYTGDFLEGDYEEWTVAERARLSTVYESVLARLVRMERSHEAAQLLLARNPYDEPSYLLLIENELSAGRIVSAEALAERCERALAEVGAQPSADLKKLVIGITRRQIQSIPKLVLPFVGRETELARVRDYLVGGSNGGALLISGEAGIGKSWFLARAADIARDHGHTVLSVGCSDTDVRTFGPFDELYADLYDEPFNPAIKNNLADVAQKFAQSLIGELDSETVFSVDDAHALRAEARSVLAALVGQLRSIGQRVFLSVRTEGLSEMQATLQGGRSENIILGPLDLDDVRAAVDSLVADNQEIVARTVFERSGGHPLFAATLLESLAQSGALRADHGTWRLVGVLDDKVALPKTLTTYIQARLRARGESASAVAAALAVEPSATVDDITAVLQLPESQVFDALDDLLALGVLIQPASGPQLAFSHDLYREVAAGTLNVGRRMRLHRGFAERFASLSSAESSLRCARHLSFAGESMAAAETYYRAAIEAMEWGAWMEARDRCGAGIANLEKLERKAEVEALLARLKMLSARVRSALGDLPAAIAVASDAVALARRSGASEMAIDAALARQNALLDSYDPEAALASSREIAGLARDAHDDAALAVALADESWSQRLLGREAEAVQAAREAEIAANAVGDSDLRCYVLEQLVLAAATWWRFDDGLLAAARISEIITLASRPAQAAMHCALAALDLALERQTDASSRIAAANALLRQGIDEPQRSLTSSQAATWLAASFGPARLKLVIAAMAARLAFEKGDVEAAIAIANELATIATPRAQQLAIIFQASALFELGEPNATITNVSPLPAQSSTFFWPDVYSGIRTPELMNILDAAVMKTSEAAQRLLHALDLVEAAARRTLLDADRAFARVARAAELCGAPYVASRAKLRRDDYREMRAAASSRAVNAGRIESSRT
ncbi:MAG: AAA family ATPase [Candidatus Eremiobacteraeota bacterium]|nr:AAA family ATPase [Candidatus Eremiobacteraeota bacterium]